PALDCEGRGRPGHPRARRLGPRLRRGGRGLPRGRPRRPGRLCERSCGHARAPPQLGRALVNPLALAGLRLKQAFSALAGRFPTGGYYGGWARNAPWAWRQKTDWTLEVGDGGGNSAVAACVTWVATTFPEAPLRVLDPEGEPVPDHPLTQLIDNPNPWYD